MPGRKSLAGHRGRLDETTGKPAAHGGKGVTAVCCMTGDIMRRNNAADRWGPTVGHAA